MEVWKDIAGYEGLYQVSNMGRVKTMARLHREDRPYMKKEMVLSPPIGSNGYKHACLYKDKKGKIHSVHTLVAKAFLDLSDKNIVNQKDGNKINNRADNLEWCTHTENRRHATENGLMKKTHAEYRRPSKWESIEMVRLYLSGYKKKDISKRFNFETRVITKAIRRLLPESFPTNGILIVRG